MFYLKIRVIRVKKKIKISVNLCHPWRKKAYCLWLIAKSCVFTLKMRFLEFRLFKK